jgi:hypothetical protein
VKNPESNRTVAQYRVAFKQWLNRMGSRRD